MKQTAASVSGFGSSVVILVAGLLVVGEMLDRTGVARAVGEERIVAPGPEVALQVNDALGVVVSEEDHERLLLLTYVATALVVPLLFPYHTG